MWVQIGSHIAEVVFEVIKTTHSIVLDLTWMKEYNPEIDWKTGDMRFIRCNCEDSTQWLQGRVEASATSIMTPGHAIRGPPLVESIAKAVARDNGLSIKYKKYTKLFKILKDFQAFLKNQP